MPGYCVACKRHYSQILEWVREDGVVFRLCWDHFVHNLNQG